MVDAFSGVPTIGFDLLSGLTVPDTEPTTFLLCSAGIRQVVHRKFPLASCHREDVQLDCPNTPKKKCSRGCRRRLLGGTSL